MSAIPCAEARESDFGDLDQGAQQAIERAKALAHYTKLADEAAAMFKPASRMEWQTHSAQMHTDARTFFLDAEVGRIRISSVCAEGCMTLNLTPAEARSIAAELIKAAESLA